MNGLEMNPIPDSMFDLPGDAVYRGPSKSTSFKCTNDSPTGNIFNEFYAEMFGKMTKA
jgi:hypothetical protein